MTFALIILVTVTTGNGIATQSHELRFDDQETCLHAAQTIKKQMGTGYGIEPSTRAFTMDISTACVRTNYQDFRRQQ